MRPPRKIFHGSGMGVDAQVLIKGGVHFAKMNGSFRGLGRPRSGRQTRPLCARRTFAKDAHTATCIQYLLRDQLVELLDRLEEAE